jgi:hypothetical protein
MTIIIHLAVVINVTVMHASLAISGDIWDFLIVRNVYLMVSDLFFYIIQKFLYRNSTSYFQKVYLSLRMPFTQVNWLFPITEFFI